MAGEVPVEDSRSKAGGGASGGQRDDAERQEGVRGHGARPPGLEV